MKYLAKFLCICITVDAIINSETGFGVVEPENAYVFIGNTLNLTCNATRSNVIDSVTAAIFFTLTSGNSERTIPAEYVRILDTDVIQLEYPIRSAADQGLFSCKMTYKNGTDEIVSSSNVTVEYRPVAPMDIQCHVYNWENMTCSWRLGQTYVNPHLVNTTLLWALSRTPYICPHQTDLACSWKSSDGKDSFQSGQRYNVLVVVKTHTSSGNRTAMAHSNWKLINTNTLVQPAPVNNIQLQSNSSLCLTTSWDSTSAFRKFQYTLQLDGHDVQINMSTRSEDLTVCNLRPATSYTIQVTSLPVVRGKPVGYSSEAVEITGTTLEDVPSAAPVVTAGSFNITSCSQTDCDVTLYWKSIPENDRNGKITNYAITITELQHTRKRDYEISSSRNFFKISHLHQDRDYIIEMKARTKIGYSARYSAIQMSLKSGRPDIPLDFRVEMTVSNLLPTWRRSADVDDSYTLYYCNGSRLNYTCSDDIQWTYVTANQTSYNISVDGHPRDYIVGISTEIKRDNETLSSGITWSSCTYWKNTRPEKVKNLISSPNQPDKALRVLWERLSCIGRPVYVLSYIISYCRTNEGSQCTDSLKNVTVLSTQNYLTLRDLRPWETYRVTVKAVGEAGEGPDSDPVFKKIVQTGLTKGQIIGVAIGCSFVLVMFLSLLVWCIRNLHKKNKNMKLEIELPPMKSDDNERVYSSYNGNNNDCNFQAGKISDKEIGKQENEHTLSDDHVKLRCYNPSYMSDVDDSRQDVSSSQLENDGQIKNTAVPVVVETEHLKEQSGSTSDTSAGVGIALLIGHSSLVGHSSPASNEDLHCPALVISNSKPTIRECPCYVSNGTKSESHTDSSYVKVHADDGKEVNKKSKCLRLQTFGSGQTGDYVLRDDVDAPEVKITDPDDRDSIDVETSFSSREPSLQDSRFLISENTADSVGVYQKHQSVPHNSAAAAFRHRNPSATSDISTSLSTDSGFQTEGVCSPDGESPAAVSPWQLFTVQETDWNPDYIKYADVGIDQPRNSGEVCASITVQEPYKATENDVESLGQVMSNDDGQHLDHSDSLQTDHHQVDKTQMSSNLSDDAYISHQMMV